MPLVACNGCGKSLRVADQRPGAKVRCPHCGAVFSASETVGEGLPRAAEPALERFDAPERAAGPPRVREPAIQPAAPAAPGPTPSEASVQEPAMGAAAPPVERSPARRAWKGSPVRSRPPQVIDQGPAGKPPAAGPAAPAAAAGLAHRPPPRSTDVPPPTDALVLPDDDRWSLRTETGHVYGPVPKDEIDAWVAEGRVSECCDLLPPFGPGWRPAAEFFPGLATATDRPSQRICPQCGRVRAAPIAACPYCSQGFRGAASSPNVHAATQGPVRTDAITTAMLVSAIANLTVGVVFTLTCYLAILGIPMLVLAAFEIGLISRAARMSPIDVATQGQTLGIFEILVGLFNLVSLACGIVVVVSASNVLAAYRNCR